MRQILTLFAILLFTWTTKAQDEPCDAIPISCGQTNITGNFTGNTLNSDLPTGCFITTNPGQRDIWFTFEADGEQGYFFYSDDNLGNSGPQHIVKLYRAESGCDDLIAIRDCHLEETFHEVFPEGTYYVQVRERLANGSDNGYTAGLICSPAPANDLRCDAQVVQCGVNYTGSLVGSSYTEITCDPPSLEYEDGGDVWFKLEAESSQTYSIFGKSGQRLSIYQVDSCDGSFSLTDSGCTSQDIEGFTGSGTYYVCAYPFDYQVKRALSYKVRLECGESQLNQNPCDAINIACEQGSILGSTSNASANQAECSLQVPDVGPSVFYKYDSQIEGNLELYVCNFDEISVFTGSCEQLECLSWGGSTCSNNPLSVNVSPDTDYYIMVWGGNGDFELFYNCQEDNFCSELNGFVGDGCDDGDVLTYNTVITSDCECVGEPIPAGSLCQNAIPIAENPFSINYYNPTVEFFLPFYHELSDIPPFLDSLGSGPVAPGCYVANDVVFSFTPEVDKFVDITASITDVNVEPNITILTGCPFTTAHIAEGCGTDNFFVKKIENFYALADTTYYILIDGQPQLTGFDFNVDALVEVVQKTFCPDLNAFQFDPCDDGNPFTLDDQITEDCGCQGTPANPGDFCDNALEIIPTPGLTVSPTQFNEDDATFSGVEQCSGVGGSRDTWFYFDAVTTNMIVGAKGKFAAYDVVLEIFDDCGEEPLVCKDQNGGGQREVHVLTNCTVGERYYVRAFDGNGFSPFNRNFFIAVSSLPINSLEESSCAGSLTLSDNIEAELPAYQYPITDWIYEFTELESPFSVIEFESPNGSSNQLTLNQVPELEAGRSYEVRVKGGIRDGQIFGDYGAACPISIVEMSGIGLVNSGNVDDLTQVEMELFPNPTNGNEVSLSLRNLPDAEVRILVRIYDLAGRQVLFEQYSSQDKSGIFTLDISQLTSGIYTVSTEAKGLITAKKLLVQ
ncbi:MAG: T9SS type A sorting domain-containing protein [Flavobacteriales bacterium]|nr:T9SS type A sorting domain-containing protein [Flavobacteriales bacterium]